MSRRKSWDQLTDKYRERLLRNGIGPQEHAAGAAISVARGKGSPQREAFSKRIYRFLNAIGSDTRDVEKQRIQALGPVKAQEYMDTRRGMVKAWEGGRHHEAQEMFRNRDVSVHGLIYRLRRSDNRLTDATWWYHGIFGG